MNEKTNPYWGKDRNRGSVRGETRTNVRIENHNSGEPE